MMRSLPWSLTPEEKYRVVTGERDLFFRNDQGSSSSFKELGMDGMMRDWLPVGLIMIVMDGPTSMWPMIFMDPIGSIATSKEKGLRRLRNRAFLMSLGYGYGCGRHQ